MFNLRAWQLYNKSKTNQSDGVGALRSVDVECTASVASHSKNLKCTRSQEVCKLGSHLFFVWCETYCYRFSHQASPLCDHCQFILHVCELVVQDCYMKAEWNQWVPHLNHYTARPRTDLWRNCASFVLCLKVNLFSDHTATFYVIYEVYIKTTMHQFIVNGWN